MLTSEIILNKFKDALQGVEGIKYDLEVNNPFSKKDIDRGVYMALSVQEMDNGIHPDTLRSLNIKYDDVLFETKFYTALRVRFSDKSNLIESKKVQDILTKEVFLSNPMNIYNEELDKSMYLKYYDIVFGFTLEEETELENGDYEYTYGFIFTVIRTSYYENQFISDLNALTKVLEQTEANVSMESILALKEVYEAFKSKYPNQDITKLTNRYNVLNMVFEDNTVPLTPEKKMPIPVYSRIYSQTEQAYVSEDEETINGLKFLSSHFKKNNIRARSGKNG